MVIVVVNEKSDKSTVTEPVQGRLMCVVLKRAGKGILNPFYKCMDMTSSSHLRYLRCPNECLQMKKM